MQRKSRLQYFLSRYKWDKIKQLKKKSKKFMYESGMYVMEENITNKSFQVEVLHFY